jgi:hypothetical protein
MEKPALVGLGVGVIIGAVGLLVGIKLGFKPFGGPQGQSPVRVVGGSTTFDYDDGWKPVARCSPGSPDTCSYVGKTNFVGKHIYIDIGDGTTLDLAGYGWQIDAQSYKADGSAIGTTGATLCNSKDGVNCDNKNAGTYLVVVPNAMGSFFAKDSPPDRDDPVNKKGKRYHSLDRSCHVEQGDFCDHLASVTITINGMAPTSYSCPVGRCVVRVDPK